MAELILGCSGAVATVVFSNVAKRNAVTYEMWQRFPAQLRELASPLAWKSALSDVFTLRYAVESSRPFKATGAEG